MIEYLNGIHVLRELYRIYRMSQGALKCWIHLYEIFGLERLRTGVKTQVTLLN